MRECARMCVHYTHHACVESQVLGSALGSPTVTVESGTKQSLFFRLCQLPLHRLLSRAVYQSQLPHSRGPTASSQLKGLPGTRSGGVWHVCWPLGWKELRLHFQPVEPGLTDSTTLQDGPIAGHQLDEILHHCSTWGGAACGGEWFRVECPKQGNNEPRHWESLSPSLPAL
jgi:hypothetical protein